MSKPIKHGKNWRIRWNDHEGKRRSKTDRWSYKDAQLALQTQNLASHRIRAGIEPAPRLARTFSDGAKEWLENRAPSKRSSVADEVILRRHLVPFFGNRPMDTITQADLDRYHTHALISLSPKTVFNHETLLIAILNRAVKIGRISQHHPLKRHSLTENRDEVSYLKSDVEISRLLSAAYGLDARAANLYEFAIFSGLRKGELAALRWEDIERSPEPRIAVQGSFDGPTKSGKIRYVPILEQLEPVLARLSAIRSSEYIFSSRTGKMLDHDNRIFREKLHQALTHAGFPMRPDRPYITFHSLRHTFAAWFLRNEGSIYALKDILGHADITTTQRYAHLVPGRFEGQLGTLKSAKALLSVRLMSGLPDGLSETPEYRCNHDPGLKELKAQDDSS
ncbi:MAG: site-specific integrase [Bdellovibrionales bacterium]|nr:site-specific integrase [Bdellovibrionales bacterium]